MKVTEAILRDDVAALRGLLAAGADPNERDEDGTPTFPYLLNEATGEASAQIRPKT